MFRRIAAVVLCLICANAFAQDCTFDSPDLLLRPGEPGQPTEVLIRVYVVDITKILDVEQSFVTDVYFRAEWTDPRLVHDGPLPCQARPDQVWTPQVQSLNRRTLDSTSPPQIRVAPDGSAFFVVRRFGEFSYEADLGDFPFDEQTLSFVIVSAYEPQDVVLRSEEAAVGMAERLSVVNWNLNFREARSGMLYVAPRDRTVARLDIEFSAKRLTGYYVWKLIVPLVLVVMMSWSVFWIAPVHVAPRLGLAATSMLTLIAYRFALASILPPIAYMTRMDLFLVFASVLVFGALAVAVAVTYVADKGRDALALRINEVARWFSPLMFAAVIVFAFWF
mgnify:FL=1